MRVRLAVVEYVTPPRSADPANLPDTDFDIDIVWLARHTEPASGEPPA
jgi:hypothetical protein